MRAALCTFNDIDLISERHRLQGIGIALCTGCYDILHAGHIKVFEEAELLGPVFVGINSDESVKALKGPSRPINKFDNRVAVVASLRMVSFVFKITSLNVVNALITLKPRWWLKGGDYTLETLNQDEVAAAKEVGSEIVLVPKVSCNSTTSIIAKL